jgi:WD40 repeat protein
MSQDQHTVVLGGTTEGIQIWDLRKTSAPVKTIHWHVNELGFFVNRSVSSISFTKELNLIAATVKDDQHSAKFYDVLSGSLVHSFDIKSTTSNFFDVSM